MSLRYVRDNALRLIKQRLNRMIRTLAKIQKGILSGFVCEYMKN